MYHRTVSYGDLEAVMQLMETKEEKARICQVINELAKRTMRGSLTPRWWLPLDTISYMGTHEAPEANVDMLNVNALAYGAPHRAVTYGATVNLTRLREITQDLAALFGIALPEPARKAATRH